MAEVGPYRLSKTITLNNPYEKPVKNIAMLAGTNTFNGENRVAIFNMISRKRAPSLSNLILLFPTRCVVEIGMYARLNPDRTIASVNVVG